jgi:16S rRNA (guanine(966)-N(2))-methyltransferase RsmD
MRVIGGTRKGKRLASFRCPSIRPTSDKVREAVFNVLERGKAFKPTSDKVREAVFNVLERGKAFKRVLDLFAGTGAMAIEALSRGSGEAVFVERDTRAVSVIKRNLKTCGLEDRARVLRRDVIGAIRYLSLRGERFGLVFIDAPYGQGALTVDTLRALAEKGLLEPDAKVVCEVSRRDPAIDTTGIKSIELIQQKKYGDTIVYFFTAG